MATTVDLGLVRGPTGPIGPMGPQGPQGETGPAGPTTCNIFYKDTLPAESDVIVRPSVFVLKNGGIYTLN